MPSQRRAQVEENQSKLGTLGIVSSRLRSELEPEHDEIRVLKKKLDGIQKINIKLTEKLCARADGSS